MGTGIYVFKIRCRDRRFDRYAYGHGFGVEAGHQQYLVTTLHHVFHCHSSEHLQIQVNRDWYLLNVTDITPPNTMDDVVVFRMNDSIGLNTVSIEYLNGDGLEIGQEAFLVSDAQCHESYPSLRYLGRLDNTELVFDGFSQKGMSGLPVSYHHKDYPREPRIAAILTGALEHPEQGMKVTGCDVKGVVKSINYDLEQKRASD
jgi:hypothetical protein